MDNEGIHRHWTNWAQAHGTELKATTRTATAKRLEVDALDRALKAVFGASKAINVLEVGCGNGVNCVELAKRFRLASFDGVDFVDEMVAAANENVKGADLGDRVKFFRGDVASTASNAALKANYDCVFTDRCIINLNTIEDQIRGITCLSEKVAPGGYLLMIENSSETYKSQNDCRTAVGLPVRTPADFNLFIDEARLRGHLPSIGLKLLRVEDFSSLHDLVLYVLLPAINGGHIDYGNEMVEVATSLSLQRAATTPSAFGSFGQNRLFVTQKTA